MSSTNLGSIFIFARCLITNFQGRLSREFDEFQVNTHLCKLRCWLYIITTCMRAMPCELPKSKRACVRKFPSTLLFFCCMYASTVRQRNLCSLAAGGMVRFEGELCCGIWAACSVEKCSLSVHSPVSCVVACSRKK